MPSKNQELTNRAILLEYVPHSSIHLWVEPMHQHLYCAILSVYSNPMGPLLDHSLEQLLHPRHNLVTPRMGFTNFHGTWHLGAVVPEMMTQKLFIG